MSTMVTERLALSVRVASRREVERSRSASYTYGTLQMCMYREVVTNFSDFSMSVSTIRLSRSR
ncbi:hypothetical protein [Nostoc sp. DSM 114159]